MLYPLEPTNSAKPNELATLVGQLLRSQQITSAMMEAAEGAMLEQEQVACPVFHHFAPGIYFREVHIPAGTFAIGHHQNFHQWNIFLKGSVTIIKSNGEQQELVAPMQFLGEPGRKIGYIHEDVVWLNAYATSETDIAKLESIFLTKSDTWQMTAEQRHAVAQLQHHEDREDFKSAVAELGFTEAELRAKSECMDDLVGMPPGLQRVKVAPSPIDGEGIFATANIQSGEQISMARISGKRTPAGRYTNHARSPNARACIINPGGDIALFALTNIKGCHGGADGDEITVDYRQVWAAIQQFQERNEL